MPFDPEAVRRALAGAPLVTRIEALDEVDTTMDRARALVREGAGEGTLVLARTQTRGRGRAEHVWASPPGGLYLSLVLEMPALAEERLALPIVAALGARAALARSGAAPRIKWPNDLFVGRRKIGGAIGEVTGRMAILGIGLNVNVPEAAFPPDLREIATSLSTETGREHDVALVARALLDALAPLHRRWLAADRALAAEAQAALILEHRVRWRAPSGMLYEGRPLGIGGRGELTIETPDGPVAAQAGDLEILWTS